MRSKVLGICVIVIGIGLSVLLSTTVAFAGNASLAAGPIVPASQPFTWQQTQVRLENGAANNPTLPFSAPAAGSSALEALLGSCYTTADNGTNIYSSADAHAVQQAVDAASAGGVVKVAGTCLGVESRAGTQQSTYISKTLTLTGGYTTTDWTTSYPITQPTVIDAAGGGRVIFATLALTVSNLTLQHGNSNYGGGGVYAGDTLALSNVQVLSNTGGQHGGGALAEGAITAMESYFENNIADLGGGLQANSTLSLTKTRFLSNTANFAGGGAFAVKTVTAVSSGFEHNKANLNGGGLETNSTLSLTNTHFVNNTAGGIGGGVSASDAVTAVNSRFENNSANDRGGGLFVGSTLTLTNTHFLGNMAGYSGGGAFAWDAVTAVDSRFENNRANQLYGGGMAANSTLSLTKTYFLGNMAGDSGGGAWVNQYYSGASRIVNSLFARNHAGFGLGNALYLIAHGGSGTAEVVYTTIASPTFASGAAIVAGQGTVTIADSIITSHTIGIQQSGGSVISQDHNLFYGNTFNTTGTVSSVGSLVGNPAFAAPAMDDYHLTSTSAAINLGANVGVNADFENDPRPQGGGFDAGYDESPFTSTATSCYATADNGWPVFGSADAHAVQQAVDAASAGGVVKVAGTCVGVESRAGTLQSVHIPITLTLTGGYTTTNWTTSYPITQPTVIDAAGSGRVISATLALTVSNLTLQHGNSNDNGGGVYAGAALALNNVQILNNIGFYGGGAWVGGAVTAVDSRFENNHALNSGGGGVWANATLSLINTHFLSNTADHYAGGAFAWGEATAVDSRFENNHAGASGGGLRVWSTLNMTNTHFLDNTANQFGGGAYVVQYHGGVSRIVNSLFAGNYSAYGSDALHLFHPTYGNSRVAQVLHTTFANPTLSSGEAIVAITNEAIGPGTLMITDCIISNYAVGIEQGGNSVVSQGHNLFFGNTTNITGTVSSGSHSVIADPAFADPSTNNYHLTAASAAIDLGVNVGVTSDFENDPRPQGGGFDAGYDESPFTSTVVSCYGVGGSIVTNTNTSETFCTIQAAIDDSDTLAGHSLEVSPGMYNEQVLVTKGVTIKGVGVTQPTVNFTGTVSGKPTLFDVSADGVTIENLHFNVDLSKLRSAVIASAPGLDNITVKDNLIDAYGTPAGSYGDRNAVSVNYGGPTNYRVATGGVNSVIFAGNTVSGTTPSSYFRSGIALDEGGGSFTGNTLLTINHDVLVRFASNGAMNITGNNFKGGGVELADQNAGAGTITVSGNTFTGAGAPGTAMLRVKNNYFSIPHVISNNTFNSFEWGVSLENMNAVTLSDNLFNSSSATAHAVVVNTKSLSSNSNTIVQGPVAASIISNTFNGAGTALTFQNHDSDNDSYGSFTIGSSGNANSFAATLSNFVVLDNQTGSSDGSTFPVYPTTGGWPTTMDCWATNLDIQSNTFDVGAGQQLPQAMNAAQRTTLESKLFHDPDASCTGLLSFFLPVHNLTQNTYHQTIQAGVNAATANDVLELAEWTFNEAVTIDKTLTLQGATSDKTKYVVNGTGLGVNSGILINNGVTGVTVRNLTVQNFTGASGNANAGIYGVGGNNGLTIDNVALLNNPTASGFYANGPVDDVSVTNSMVANNSGGARGIVIWNGLKSNITITGNMVTNNACCGIELQDGDASGVNISGNTIDIGGGDNAIGVVGLNPSVGANIIDSNVITGGGRFGIEIKNPAGGVTVNGNLVTLSTQNADVRDRAGIAILRRGVLPGNVDVPNGVTITGNTVAGYQQSSTNEGFGIVVEGTNHTVTGNTMNNNEVGILQQQNPSNYPGDADQSNLADQYFGRGNSPMTCGNIISGNSFSGNGVDTRNIGVGGGIVQNTDTSETFCSIQAAIDDSDTLNGHVISVAAGLYAESVAVTKGVDLRGPNYGVSPNSGSRVTEAIVVPATDDIAGGVVFAVAASNVSINGFTIDGDNTLLTNGFTSTTSADINAAEGVAVYVDNVNTLTVSKNIIQNLSYFGVTLFGAPGSGQATSGHLVHDNLFKDLGTYAPGSGIANWGGGVLLKKNQYARVTNNVMNNVRVGVQTDHFSQANPGAATYQVIDGNTMNVRRSGIFLNDHSASASPYTLSNNIISGLASPHETGWEGILLATLTGGYSAVAQNNTIDGSAVNNPSEGYEVWMVDFPATISGGSVRGVSTGVFVNNVEDYSGWKGEGAHAIVNSLRITPTANGVGIHVLDSPSSSHHSVSVTVQDDCEIVQSGQTGAGIRVEGGSAFASVQDNDASIHGFAIGIDVNGSAASITNDHIYDNGIGVRVTNAGMATITGNTIGPNTTGVLVENGSAATLTCNNITGNATYGVNNTTASIVNAEGNWWGAVSGPFHRSNPAGAGDAVSDNVDFAPWATAAAPGGCTSLAETSTTGHFYLGATGAIIPGGSIGVSGPNTITVAQNGATGFYQWLTSGATGQYTLAATPPPGYVLSPACPAQAASLDPTGNPSPLVLGAGEVGNTGVLSNNACSANPYYLSFALAQGDPLILNNNLPLQGTASIGDRVWNDLDKDGVQDGGEPGIAGVTLNLYTAGDATPIATTTTNASGIYTFSSIYSSTFRIQIDIPEFFPSGTLFGFAASPTGAQSVTDPQTFDYTVTVPAGQVMTNVDFGLYGSGKSTIGDYVWRDLNGNGQHNEANELEYVAGINGVKVNVYRDDGDLSFDPDPTGVNGDLLYATTMTTGTNAGFYSVDVVAFGKAYWVEVIASNFTAGGPLFGLTTTNTASPNLDRQWVQTPNVPQYSDDTIDFGYASSGYALEKILRTPPVARIGDIVRFAIRITNTGEIPLTQIPLTDTYNTNFLLFVSGAPAPNNNADDGVLNWSNVLTTPLNAGAVIEVQLVFLAGFDTTWLGPGGTVNVAETNNVIAIASLGGPPINLGARRDDASVVILSPTAVTVLRFNAETANGVTHVMWETGEESNIAGFALSRRGADGIWVQINATMIPAQVSGEPRGASYLFVDDAPGDAAMLYRLDAITLDQTVMELGVVAPVSGGVRVFLPVVVK